MINPVNQFCKVDIIREVLKLRPDESQALLEMILRNKIYTTLRMGKTIKLPISDSRVLTLKTIHSCIGTIGKNNMNITVLVLEPEHIHYIEYVAAFLQVFLHTDAIKIPALEIAALKELEATNKSNGRRG